MSLTDVAQGLDNQSADASGGGHVFGCCLFEDDLRVPDSHSSIGAIGEEYDLGGHLE